jgi:hypothetical protein
VNEFSALLKFGSFNTAQHPMTYIDLVWQTLIAPFAHVHSVLMSTVNHFVIIRQTHTPPRLPVPINTQGGKIASAFTSSDIRHHRKNSPFGYLAIRRRLDHSPA